VLVTSIVSSALLFISVVAMVYEAHRRVKASSPAGGWEFFELFFSSKKSHNSPLILMALRDDVRRGAPVLVPPPPKGLVDLIAMACRPRIARVDAKPRVRFSTSSR
jgi:hypothetical protein